MYLYYYIFYVYVTCYIIIYLYCCISIIAHENVIVLITLPILTNYANSLIGGRIGFWFRYQSMTFFTALSLTQDRTL